MARKKEAKKVDVDTIAQTEAPQKRAGRKPMTAEEKAAASKKRAEEKAKADSLSPILILQYMGEDIDTTALVEAAKADYGYPANSAGKSVLLYRKHGIV